MAGRGKRYRELYSKVDREQQYSPAEAVRLVKEMQSTKFTETVECHIRTGLNVRHAEEQLRGTITLPHMAGTDVTVAVFAKGDRARDAEAAGADVVGDEDLAKRIQDGWTRRARGTSSRKRRPRRPSPPPPSSAGALLFPPHNRAPETPGRLRP